MEETKRFKVAASIICGDDIHKDNYVKICKAIDSLIGEVEKVYLAYNGTKNIKKLIRKYGDFLVVDYFKWEEDFGSMRNHAFSMIPKRDYDWIIWIDSDDQLVCETNLQDMLQSLDCKTQMVMLKYDYAVIQEVDNVFTEQWRERLFRTDANWVWKFMIHELCIGPPGIQAAKPNNVKIVHNREIPEISGDLDTATRERNRKIIAKARRLYPEEPRYQFYFANEIYAEAAAKRYYTDEPNEEEVKSLVLAGINAYEKYLDMNPAPDDAYVAIHQISELYKIVDQNLKSIESDIQAILINPSWPSAYVSIAESYANMEDWDRAIFWAEACIKNCSIPETSAPIEPNDLYVRPHFILAAGYEATGRLDEAIEQFKKVMDVTPTEGALKAFEELKERATKLPEVEEESFREKMFNSNKEKSIAFLCLPSVEPWSTKSMNNGGIGGTETAICEIAKRYAKEGWRVVIFASPHEEYRDKIVDGIEWYDTSDFSPTEEFTIFVGLRNPMLFENNIKSKIKILWMHDVNSGNNFVSEFGNLYENIDYIAGVSEWHCDHMSKLYNIPREKFITLRNGINQERFIYDLCQKNPSKIIWSSSPDRGLDVLLQMWPRIRDILPTAELHIFYGWESINKILEHIPDHYIKDFKEAINKTIDDLGATKAGIYWRGRVDQQSLAAEMATASYWLYPSYFLETACITALEMQASGVLPITSNHGGLVENLNKENKKIDGWPRNITYQKDFLSALDNFMKLDSNKKDEIIKNNRKFALEKSWDSAFSSWKELVK